MFFFVVIQYRRVDLSELYMHALCIQSDRCHKSYSLRMREGSGILPRVKYTFQKSLASQEFWKRQYIKLELNNTHEHHEASDLAAIDTKSVDITISSLAPLHRISTILRVTHA